MKTSFRSIRSSLLLASFGALFAATGCAAGNDAQLEALPSGSDTAGGKDVSLVIGRLSNGETETRKVSFLGETPGARPIIDEPGQTLVPGPAVGTTGEERGGRDDHDGDTDRRASTQEGDKEVENTSPAQHDGPEDGKTCDADADCTIVETKCCDHCNGGEADAFNKTSAADHEPQACGNTACTRVGCAEVVASCENHRCVAITKDLPTVL